MLSFYLYIPFRLLSNRELNVFKICLRFEKIFTELSRIFANLQTKVVCDPKTL